jgi:hypothetical protein
VSSSAPSNVGLAQVTTFIVGAGVLGETLEFLRDVGTSHSEGFVLWTGVLEGPTVFRFASALIPAQQAIATNRGLLVTVDGGALFEINKTAHERGQTLAAQVHTHPTSAFHSGTDDHYPLVTLVGALSVVIPDFAVNAPGDIDRWAWYRLLKYGHWAVVGTDTEVVFE